MTKEEALNWIGISLFIDYDEKDSKKIEEAYKIICKEFEMLDIFYNILSLFVCSILNYMNSRGARNSISLARRSVTIVFSMNLYDL